MERERERETERERKEAEQERELERVRGSVCERESVHERQSRRSCGCRAAGRGAQCSLYMRETKLERETETARERGSREKKRT